VCALCLARYRSQRRVDEARLAALTRQLMRQPRALPAGWSAELKPPLARNLAPSYFGIAAPPAVASRAGRPRSQPSPTP
jgi:hypothetical protein